MSELSFTVRHGYGIAAFGISLCNTPILLFLAKFLVDEAGIDPLWAGALVFVGKLWDAFTDPFVGRLTDRTRTSWGPRRPWILAGVWPLALFCACLWQPLPLEGWLQISGYGLLLIAYNTALTMVVVPYGALTPVLATSYDSRTSLNAARMGWSILGGIVAAIVVPLVRDLTSGSYGTGTTLLAFLSIAPILMAVYVTSGKDEPGQHETPPLGTSVFGVSAFRRVAFLFVCAWGSLSIVAAIIPFYIQHFVGRPDLEDLLLGTIQISALISVPLVVYAASRTQKHFAYVLLMSSWAALLIGMSLAPQGSWKITWLLMALAGPGMAAAHILPWSMLPDVVDADREQTGRDRSGAFYGAMTFVEKVASAFALQAAMMALSFGGYIAQAEVQSPEAINVLAMVMGPFPAVLLVAACAVAVVWPPPTREQQHALQ